MAGQSVLVTLLTLIIAYLANETPLRAAVTFAASKVAAASVYLFGIGNSTIAIWWIYCCIASVIGGVTFIVGRVALEPGYLLAGPLLITTLLLPAILLQGASHNHGYAAIGFAVFSTFAGTLVGTGTGLIVRRQFSFRPG